MKMDEVDVWQAMAVGDKNSELKEGPSRNPIDPFPAKVETGTKK